MAWLIQKTMDSMEPKSETVRRAYELIALECGDEVTLRCAYISSFIDDFPSLCVESMCDTFEEVAAAAWIVLGFEPQGKKCWFEGGFAAVAQVLGIKV